MSLTVTPPSYKPPALQSDDLEEPRRRLLTREEYYRAAALGIFGPEERLELIKGEVISKVSPQRTPHAIGTSLSANAFAPIVDGVACHLRQQQPLTFPDDSEPEPDIAVVRGNVRDYLPHHPFPEDVLLVMEVSDSTVRFDQGRKANLYAEVGIPDYWMLNIPLRRLEVRRDPVDGEYRTTRIFAKGDMVSPLFAPQASISVADLLPSLPAEGTAADV